MTDATLSRKPEPEASDGEHCPQCGELSDPIMGEFFDLIHTAIHELERTGEIRRTGRMRIGRDGTPHQVLASNPKTREA
jgi:hypothetical protein